MYDELQLLLIRAGGVISDTKFNLVDDKPVHILCDPTWDETRRAKAVDDLGGMTEVMSSMWVLDSIGDYHILDKEDYC